MKIEDRVRAFERLGKHLQELDAAEFEKIAERARQENSWFTSESLSMAIQGVLAYLDGPSLRKWVDQYSLDETIPGTIAVIMAGNIPMVGFHDFLCVLISGHNILIKQSSKDTVLLPWLSSKLIEVEPRFKQKITFAEQLKGFDAVIATGSDNSARYFHFYFGKYPNIIRKNRTSCAVLNGKETDADLNKLGKDVFTYFGLGCRNVSKVFVPAGYKPNKLFEAWEPYQQVMMHHKYHNNYDYQKSIMLLNKEPFLDNGFVMLRQTEKLVSPISVVFVEEYNDEGALALKLNSAKDKIQCVVGIATPGAVPFGQAQKPRLWDYADQVDTLEFLSNLR